MIQIKWLLAGVSALIAAPAMLHSAQFVLFDVTFTYSKTDADTSTPSKSHYYVRGAMLNPDRPRDWTTPADYRNGSVHIRAEVIEKPAGAKKPPGRCVTSPIKVRGTATAARARASTPKKECTSKTCR